MLDRSIPFYNTILKCESCLRQSIVLPEGYHFKEYQAGDERGWARLEYAIGDFKTIDEAENYFVSEYCQNINYLRNRCVFIVDHEEQIVGSCIAWRDHQGNQTVASLHWLVVSPGHQGKHLGKALCQQVLNIFQERNEFPIYIHTQPWSYIAILLYVQLGFKLQTIDTFSQYVNQYEQSMQVLKGLLTEQQFSGLIKNSI